MASSLNYEQYQVYISMSLWEKEEDKIFKHSAPEPRPEELQKLKGIVLSETNQRVVVTGRMRRVGVLGMGGIGKTVLATALARDEEVRRAFRDGLFWLKLTLKNCLWRWGDGEKN